LEVFRKQCQGAEDLRRELRLRRRPPARGGEGAHPQASGSADVRVRRYAGRPNQPRLVNPEGAERVQRNDHGHENARGEQPMNGREPDEHEARPRETTHARRPPCGRSAGDTLREVGRRTNARGTIGQTGGSVKRISGFPLSSRTAGCSSPFPCGEPGSARRIYRKDSPAPGPDIRQVPKRTV
jgi:hypothetical protein